eukprot:FR737911.1.p2 GENE.FR737911.1~~FR737911.1.p2  ORF type:complete len:147 (+),score=75.83 FR737911.1:792-1232(+)
MAVQFLVKFPSLEKKKKKKKKAAAVSDRQGPEPRDPLVLKRAPPRGGTSRFLSPLGRVNWRAWAKSWVLSWFPGGNLFSPPPIPPPTSRTPESHKRGKTRGVGPNGREPKPPHFKLWVVPPPGPPPFSPAPGKKPCFPGPPPLAIF